MEYKHIADQVDLRLL